MALLKKVTLWRDLRQKSVPLRENAELKRGKDPDIAIFSKRERVSDIRSGPGQGSPYCSPSLNRRGAFAGVLDRKPGYGDGGDEDASLDLELEQSAEFARFANSFDTKRGGAGRCDGLLVILLR
ncbi:hypothetical protein TcasGA2_TC000951 [Tribolium castaneum]|uniref:Uncharacterized protein n=1 Tax=Tribolium castaneum TaxID=7070 RepID=D6W982_TRICA|nr:hypothetical protein TcasGA2_TC000951 [Tribolium castaneum]